MGLDIRAGHTSQHMTDGAATAFQQRWLLAVIHTDKFMDGDPIEDIEGRVQLKWLTAPLTHEADLHGCARWLGALHR